MTEAQVVRTGDVLADLTLRRYGAGIRVHVKVHPVVEAYFHDLSHGAVTATPWRRVPPPPAQLAEQYDVPPELRGELGLPSPSDDSLLIDQRPNLGLLALVGAGTPEGTTIIVPTVCTSQVLTRDALQIVAERFKETVADFYRDYIKAFSARVVLKAGEPK